MIRQRQQHNSNQTHELVIYNEHNQPLNASAIHQIWSRYSKSPIAIDDKSLNMFRIAVTHRSYVRSIIMGDGAKRKKGDHVVADLSTLRRRQGTMDLQEESYDRLELVGDSIFHCVLTKYLYNRFPTQDEGFLTRLRAKIEKGDCMATIAKKLHLEKWVVISKELEFEGKREDDKILEDVFEAMMGAMFICFGYQKCENIIWNICSRDIDFPTLLQVDDNYKDQLLRYYHRMQWPDPTYKCRQEEDKSFTACVGDARGKPLTYGNARSKPKAEQLAAKRALESFGMIGEGGETLMNTRDLDVLLAPLPKKSINDEEDIEISDRKENLPVREKMRVHDARLNQKEADKTDKGKRVVRREEFKKNYSSENDTDDDSDDLDHDSGDETNSSSNSDTDDSDISPTSKQRRKLPPSTKSNKSNVKQNKKKSSISSDEDIDSDDESLKPNKCAKKGSLSKQKKIRGKTTDKRKKKSKK